MKIGDALRAMMLSKKEQEYHQLYTQWGEKLNANDVRKEYPRPQLKRENYTMLNGSWDYLFNKSELIPEEYQGKILVPFSPESVLSGVNRQLQPDEVLWYRKTFRVASLPEGERCILHFGAIDQICDVYINHKKKMNHVGGYLPFSLDMTDELKSGVNEIEVKVTDVSDTSYHSKGKQKLERGGMFYTAQSGIWQPVWME